MAVLSRISPASAFKIGLVAYALVGLVAGVLCSLFALSGAPFAPHAHVPLMRAVGLGAVVICPLVYGIIGGIAAILSAIVYNLAAHWVGGVEVELRGS